MTGPVVIKFGGELLEDPEHLKVAVAVVARVATSPASTRGLVVVHGAGKEIDAALKSAGIAKQQVDGLRITDEGTLDVVIAVLGAVNTRFVAALTVAGVSAVGLTGADGGCGLAEPAPPHRAVNGRLVDLGQVGVPSRGADVRLVTSLVEDRFVPVIACIGIGRDGRLLNVNADTFAGHMAARLGADRLVIAGSTAGVLDDARRTVAAIDPQMVERLIGAGTATAGMVAKLRACEHALARGVAEVVIVDGRDRDALEAAAVGTPPASATRLVTAAASRT